MSILKVTKPSLELCMEMVIVFWSQVKVIFTKNRAEFGGAIKVEENFLLTVSDSEISQNFAHFGAGISANDNANCLITESKVYKK